jgi:RNA polymerase-associated protein CTR9
LAQLNQLSSSQTNNAAEKKEKLGESVKYYADAIRLLSISSPSLPLPLSLINNYCVAYFQQGEYEKAAQLFRQYIPSPSLDKYIHTDASEQTKEDVPYFPPHSVTYFYNYSLCLEKIREINKAERIYRGILSSVPQYIDCSLRLSLLCEKRGDTERAIEIVKEVIDKNPSSIPALTQLGCIYQTNKQYTLAQKQFMQVIKLSQSLSSPSPSSSSSSSSGDSYSKLCLGNIHYALYRESSSLSHSFSNPSDKRAVALYTSSLESLERAGRFFRSVLDKEKNNLYAANGLGCVLVGEGKWGEAREIFTQCREAEPDNKEIQMNLANCLCQLGQYSTAIQIYAHLIDIIQQQGSRSSSPAADSPSLSSSAGDPSLSLSEQIHLLLCRAHYLAGHMEEAEKQLVRLIHFNPDNCQYTYNLALTREQRAVEALQKPKEERTLAAVKQAIEYLETAKELFNRLASLPPPPPSSSSSFSVSSSDKKAASSRDNVLAYIRSKSVTHRQFCEFALLQASPHLSAAREREEQMSAAQRESEEKARAYMRQREMKEEEKRAAEEEKRKEREAFARQKAERLLFIQAEWEEKEREREREKKTESDEEKEDKRQEMEDIAHAAKEREKRRKKGGKKKKKRDVDDYSEEEEENVSEEEREEREKETEGTQPQPMNDEEGERREEEAERKEEEEGGADQEKGKAPEEEKSEAVEEKRVKTKRSRLVRHRDADEEDEQPTERATAAQGEGEEEREGGEEEVTGTTELETGGETAEGDEDAVRSSLNRKRRKIVQEEDEEGDEGETAKQAEEPQDETM